MEENEMVTKCNQLEIIDGIEMLRQEGFIGYWDGKFEKGGKTKNDRAI